MTFGSILSGFGCRISIVKQRFLGTDADFFLTGNALCRSHFPCIFPLLPSSHTAPPSFSFLYLAKAMTVHNTLLSYLFRILPS